MLSIATPFRNRQASSYSEEIQNGIQNHKKTAAYLIAAAERHLEAAKYYEMGDTEKAARSTIAAHGEHCLASVAQRKDSTFMKLLENFLCKY